MSSKERLMTVLLAPHVSEKSAIAADLGNASWRFQRRTVSGVTPRKDAIRLGDGLPRSSRIADKIGHCRGAWSSE